MMLGFHPSLRTYRLKFAFKQYILFSEKSLYAIE